MPRLSRAGRTDPAADVAAIVTVNEGILGALNSGDWRKLNELTAADYVAIIGGRPIQGKAQLEASNQRFLEQWRDEEKWNPDETVVDGDLAFQRGSFTMTLSPRDGRRRRAQPRGHLPTRVSARCGRHLGAHARDGGHGRRVIVTTATRGRR